MQQSKPRNPVYLSDQQIRAFDFDSADVFACVERALVDQTRPLPRALKATVVNASGSYFQALPALVPGEAIASVKWVSVIAGASSLPSVQATVLLTSTADGSLLAVLDGTWITTARTAAMSALAAKYLARPGSERIGFIGCGAQAIAHLRSLKLLFPSLSTVVAHGRSLMSAITLCEEVRRLGMTARTSEIPREAVEEQDIVVSTVPAATLERPFLDGCWLKPGGFATMVDLGRSWRPETLNVLDVVATDERTQSEALAVSGKLALAGPYDYDLSELVSGAAVWDPCKRSIFVFGGLGVCDAAVALLCYRKAHATELPSTWIA